MTVEAAKIIIHGRVQGVWFRASTKDAADAIGGISGWVRNMANGIVEVYAEGEKTDVEKLIEWCKHGPPLARVTNVEIEWVKPQGIKNLFKVSY